MAVSETYKKIKPIEMKQNVIRHRTVAAEAGQIGHTQFFLTL